MSRGGPTTYCAECEKLTHNGCVKLNKAHLPPGRCWHKTDHPDVQWFRRARQCGSCGQLTVTAEIAETFVEELVELRRQIIRRNSAVAKRITSALPVPGREEVVPKPIAQQFVRRSAWWLTHSSGKAVRAPGHAANMYLSDRHGWAINFGANTFLVGKAVERCVDAIREDMDRAGGGRLLSWAQLRERLYLAISGAVANYGNYEYGGFYPISGDELVFGAQAINVSDAADYILALTIRNEPEHGLLFEAHA
jgi:hypothetical protein